ncbi:MAG: 3-methyl-2-oxobutanoate hydroxymethyltransferase, partial [Pirellulaceae bacterium]
MGKTSSTPSSGTLPPGSHGTSSPVTVRSLKQAKESGRRVTMLTVYDYPTARLLDQAGIDMLLVGDSLGMVVQG